VGAVFAVVFFLTVQSSCWLMEANLYILLHHHSSIQFSWSQGSLQHIVQCKESSFEQKKEIFLSLASVYSAFAASVPLKLGCRQINYVECKSLLSSRIPGWTGSLYGCFH
jgi:hypothetical protein